MTTEYSTTSTQNGTYNSTQVNSFVKDGTILSMSVLNMLVVNGMIVKTVNVGLLLVLIVVLLPNLTMSMLHSGMLLIVMTV